MLNSQSPQYMRKVEVRQGIWLKAKTLRTNTILLRWKKFLKERVKSWALWRSHNLMKKQCMRTVPGTLRAEHQKLLKRRV